jgi:hypothetical protein
MQNIPTLTLFSIAFSRITSTTYESVVIAVIKQRRLMCGSGSGDVNAVLGDGGGVFVKAIPSTAPIAVCSVVEE